MKPALAFIGSGVKAYHGHILRGRWQQAAIRAIQETADGTTAVLLIDFVMVCTNLSLLSKHCSSMPTLENLTASIHRGHSQILWQEGYVLVGHLDDHEGCIRQATV